MLEQDSAAVAFPRANFSRYDSEESQDPFVFGYSLVYLPVIAWCLFPHGLIPIPVLLALVRCGRVVASHRHSCGSQTGREKSSEEHLFFKDIFFYLN